MFVPAANYPHKNLKILNQICNILSSEYPEFNYIFYVTLKSKDFSQLHFTGNKHICNLGVLSITEVAETYHSIDCLFLPTLQECVSASFIEAMYTMTPIITSDLHFIRHICETAAVYINPTDGYSIAKEIVLLSNDERKRQEWVNAGSNVLKKFGTPQSRANAYHKILEEISNKINN